MVAVDSQSSHSAFSPFGEPKRLSIKQSPSIAGDVDFRLHSTQNTLPSPQIPSGFGSSTPNASGSDESSDEDEKFSNIDMEALRQRGKGSYFCPLGVRCKKGGVDKDGRPIRFDRNSSFAYASHLNHLDDQPIVRAVHNSLTANAGSIAINIENHGGATFPDAQTHPKSASLPAEMVWKDTRPL